MSKPILWTPPGCSEALRLEQFGGMKYWRAPGVGLSFYNLDGEPTYSATVNGNTARDPDPIAALNAAHAKMLEALGGLVPTTLTKRQLIAWLTDRMRQYDQTSGTFHAFELLIDQVESGDPWERLRHGELDDLLGEEDLNNG